LFGEFLLVFMPIFLQEFGIQLQKAGVDGWFAVKDTLLEVRNVCFPHKYVLFWDGNEVYLLHILVICNA
jgi:hypothetical protein